MLSRNLNLSLNRNKVLDLNGNKVINAADHVIIGRTQPKYIFGTYTPRQPRALHELKGRGGARFH